jgi:hypothetical protein
MRLQKRWGFMETYPALDHEGTPTDLERIAKQAKTVQLDRLRAPKSDSRHRPPLAALSPSCWVTSSCLSPNTWPILVGFIRDKFSWARAALFPGNWATSSAIPNRQCAFIKHQTYKHPPPSALVLIPEPSPRV